MPKPDAIFFCNPLVIKQGLIQRLKPLKRCCRQWLPLRTFAPARVLVSRGAVESVAACSRQTHGSVSLGAGPFCLSRPGLLAANRCMAAPRCWLPLFLQLVLAPIQVERAMLMEMWRACLPMHMQ